MRAFTAARGYRECSRSGLPRQRRFAGQGVSVDRLALGRHDDVIVIEGRDHYTSGHRVDRRPEPPRIGVQPAAPLGALPRTTIGTVRRKRCHDLFLTDDSTLGGRDKKEHM